MSNDVSAGCAGEVSKSVLAALLKQDVQQWNKWRQHNSEPIDLSNVDLSNADLSGANLRYVKLVYADLRYSILRAALLDGADLRGALYTYSSMSREQLELFHRSTDETISLVD